ncbi:MAG: hypothetical protein K9J12_09665 [Melioribacteraceae bacterium]|nr:hypothetical protein [Melioribacteraceae bacterium]MCF8265955.1 hypothetical protein [Melioribacteraceae bacterium]MCF8413473.1 hypothetical protein [Melioribacteraceae bacterium]MCF8432739.1 hypothetical protein [Melioribacteraceae bacterium]
MTKILMFALLIYVAYSIAKIVMRLFSGTNSNSSTRRTTTKKKESKINYKDVVEAEFEEIEEKNSPKEN